VVVGLEHLVAVVDVQDALAGFGVFESFERVPNLGLDRGSLAGFDDAPVEPLGVVDVEAPLAVGERDRLREVNVTARDYRGPETPPTR
jgi:hypothetical protein